MVSPTMAAAAACAPSVARATALARATVLLAMPPVATPSGLGPSSLTRVTSVVMIPPAPELAGFALAFLARLRPLPLRKERAWAMRSLFAASRAACAGARLSVSPAC